MIGLLLILRARPGLTAAARKGTPADPLILSAARDLGARVVTHDRFRDWKADNPEIGTPGFLIRGGYRSGELWLDLDQEG